ncbi:MAG: Hsp20/alpha crystallin family protein [Thermoanaerobaculia bacterium]
MSSKRQLDQVLRLRRKLGSLLEESLVEDRLDEADVETPGAWTPTADVLETETDFRIEAELPGVLRADLEVKLDGTGLELHGTRRPPGGAGNFHRLEGRYGPFHRIVTLSGELDTDGVEARLEDGVLFVRVPKKKPDRRSIPVDWEGDDG